MLTPGLVSVTFRKLSAGEIIEAVRRAGAGAVEWGGDVHVPHGDVERACDVRRMCEDAGVACPSYGSYYKLAWEDAKNPAFERVIESAEALGAGVVRVWAGTVGSDKATGEYRKRAAEDARRICDLAAGAGVKVSLEYHRNTLTDTNESAQQFLKEVGHENLWTHWQPAPGMSREDRAAGLKAVLPRLTVVHVYHYTGKAYEPLAGIREEWAEYLGIVKGSGRDHHCMIEFVRGETVGQFVEDVGVLRELIGRGR